MVFGSAVATAAGAAAGLAQGAVRGAVEVASSPRAALPAPPADPATEDESVTTPAASSAMEAPAAPVEVPPPPEPPASPRPYTGQRRRARSDERTIVSGSAHCLACWTANPGHRAHLYRGDCSVLPGRSVWGSRSGPEPRPQPLLDRPAELPVPRFAALMNGAHSTPTAAEAMPAPDSQESLFASVHSTGDGARTAASASIDARLT